MKNLELTTTPVKSYNLTLCEGKPVVRNQSRINGLIGVRNSLIPNKYHGLLANVTFTGNMVNETIIWTTDVFNETPSRLSELTGEVYAKYSSILKSAMQAYANAFQNAEPGVKALLYAAVTYSSEDFVYCAEDRVVITAWGMTKKGEAAPIGMQMFIDDAAHKHPTRYDYIPTTPADAHDGTLDEEPLPIPPIEEKPEPESDNVDNDKLEENVQGNNESNNSTVVNPTIEPTYNPVSDTPSNRTSSNNEEHFNENSSDAPIRKNKWWYWLLPLLILLILATLFMKGCSSSKVLPVAPDIDSTQVVLSDDSLRYVVDNRLLLLITKDGVTVDDFVKGFRKKYPDDKTYILSNPDTLIKRLTLTCPSEERSELETRLPDEFAEFGLIVIPETMYKSSYQSNDPDLADENKRWYFDECSVFESWDVTMGSEDIIVAIIDDGFDLNHPELKGKIVKPYNASNRTSNVTPSPSGHGTHVAATAIGNADNNTGISGIAPKCKLMPIQVGDAQGNMTTTAVYDGVIYAINNGADVVNMSLGMSFGPFVQFAPLHVQKNFRANMFLQEERVWNHLFNIARQKNTVFVLSGGNDNCLIGLDPMKRTPNAIKVSAVKPDTQKANFSNYGDLSTVSAPGVRIFNAIPGNRYTYMDGTSMASPIVAGGCALLKSRDPNLSVAELAQILRETGKPSSSDVGPIVNFARALNAEYNDVDECSKINERYNELLKELEEIRKKYPGCIQTPDTLSIPKGLSIEQLTGRWKSTTSLYNEQEEEVVIYFTFNGTPTAILDIVEPNGSNYRANLSVSISNDQVHIDQTVPARCTGISKAYNPYKFVLKPSPDRKAEGNAKNKIETANIFNFNLIKI